MELTLTQEARPDGTRPRRGRPVRAALEGPRTTLTTGSLALGILYAVLAPVHVVVQDGSARWVMGSVALTASLTCALLWWRTTHPRREGLDLARRQLVVLCLVPLVTSIAHVAVTRSLGPTSMVMLGVVAVGAVHDRARPVVVLLVATVVAWVVVVAVRAPQPVEDTAHHAARLLLACALGAGLSCIRASQTRKLVAAQDELVHQLVESDRLRTESQRSADRFSSLFVHSPVGVCLADELGRVVEANPALCRLFGRSRDELLGRSSLEHTHPDDRDQHARATQLIETAPDGVAKIEKRYLRPDGEVRWAWLTVRHVPGPRGETYTLAQVEDVTDRKADLEKLRQSQEVMRAAIDIAHASQEDGDPRARVVHAATSVARAGGASLIERVGDGELRVTAATDDRWVGTVIDLGQPSASAHVWRTGESLFVPRGQSHPLVDQRLLALSDFSSMLWQPVVASGRTVALLSVGWSDAVSDISDFEREAVAAVAGEAALALRAEQLRRQLEASTVTDPLTGLANRRGWDLAAAELARQVGRTGTSSTIGLVDLDHFKAYNDSHGHLLGDQALSDFASRARAVLREGDVIARWGGEEFAVALRGLTVDAALPVLERLRLATPEGLTCSVGCAEVLDGDVAAAMERADAALFEAKGSGRDRVVQARPAPGRGAGPGET